MRDIKIYYKINKWIFFVYACMGLISSHYIIFKDLDEILFLGPNKNLYNLYYYEPRSKCFISYKE